MLKYLTPSLAMLAAIPAAQAFDVMGDGWEMSIEPRIQSRIEFGSTSDSAGDDADPWSGATEADGEDVGQFNFYLHRARIYFKGKSDDGWKWNYTIMADKIGVKEDRDGPNIETRYAYVGKSIKSGDLKHYVQFGLDKHTSNQADVDSSSSLLFPNGRYAAEYAGPRSIGIDYQLTAPLFNLRAGIADEMNDEANDLAFYVRVATPLFADWKLDKRKQSYVGKDGIGHELGLGIDIISDGSDVTTEDDGEMVINLDYLIHYNQITGIFDFSYVDKDSDVTGMIVSAQAGYAVPLESGKVVEPALRVAMIDNDTDDDEEAGQLVQEGGDSGIYFDVGVNYYISGHKNKLQAGLQFYTPEEGDGDGMIFRLAHQLDF